MYSASIKQRGKWYTVAMWAGGSDTCPALADKCFRMAGVKFDFVHFTTQLEKQTNFGGYRPDCQNLTTTPEQVDEWSDLQHYNMLVGFGRTIEQILDVYPEFSKFTTG